MYRWSLRMCRADFYSSSFQNDWKAQFCSVVQAIIIHLHRIQERVDVHIVFFSDALKHITCLSKIGDRCEPDWTARCPRSSCCQLEVEEEFRGRKIKVARLSRLWADDKICDSPQNVSAVCASSFAPHAGPLLHYRRQHHHYPSTRVPSPIAVPVLPYGRGTTLFDLCPVILSSPPRTFPAWSRSAAFKKTGRGRWQEEVTPARLVIHFFRLFRRIGGLAF
jgi:hypothetical protein